MHHLTANPSVTPAGLLPSLGTTCLRDIQKPKPANGNSKSAHHNAQTHLPTWATRSLKWMTALKRSFGSGDILQITLWGMVRL